ncbi:MAG: metallophosphoesterase family protein [Gemmatimonadaceae bacterium]|nr:metallophosphoesterase family protein [Chitinophagaceae bacterium]
MKKIGLISDTHGYMDPAIAKHFESCDEIWHAGDFGNATIAESLKQVAPLKGVYGNIDGNDIRTIYPLELSWTCEEVKVFMTHIGGFPPRYNNIVRPLLEQNRPKLFIAGHSHILKVMYDEKIGCLHMNPGAAGRQGWHKVRTIIRFDIDGADMKNCKVIELGNRA